MFDIEICNPPTQSLKGNFCYTLNIMEVIEIMELISNYPEQRVYFEGGNGIPLSCISFFLYSKETPEIVMNVNSYNSKGHIDPSVAYELREFIKCINKSKLHEDATFIDTSFNPKGDNNPDKFKNLGTLEVKSNGTEIDNLIEEWHAKYIIHNVYKEDHEDYEAYEEG